MKRFNYITFTFITIILFQCTSTQAKKNNWATNQLKGKVKSIIQLTYTAKEYYGEIREDEFFERIYFKFDNRGNKKYTLRDGNCRIENYYYYFDRFDNCIMKSRKDDYGYVLEETIYEKTGYVTKDSWGGETFYCGKPKHSYDKNHNLIKSCFYDENNVYTGKTTYSYNDQNKEIEAITYNENNILKIRTNWEYNDKGQVIKETTNNYYDFTKTTTEYDNSGNTLSIEEKKGGPNHSIKRWRYLKFDKQWNWTKRVVYIDGDLRDIQTRKYVYYE